jgi:hypothetical protein
MPNVIVYVPQIDLTGIDFTIVLAEVLAMVPIILPVIIGFIAFRKGYSFLIGALRGA